jgi:hypothetical protein
MQVGELQIFPVIDSESSVDAASVYNKSAGRLLRGERRRQFYFEELVPIS